MCFRYCHRVVHFFLQKQRTLTTIMFAFPHPALTPIVGRPTHATLALLKLELYANAMSTESFLGGGNHGYLGLVMSPADYALLPGTITFVKPVNPGQQPPHLPEATVSQMTEANRRYDYSVAKYIEYRNIHCHLKVQITNAVHAIYIHNLQDPLFGYAFVPAREILMHLVDQYGTTEDLEIINPDKLKADWNPYTDTTIADAREAEFIKLYYCHSCGLTPVKNHTSLTCNRPKPGHKAEATATNMMNGSTTVTIKHRTRRRRTPGNRTAGTTRTPPTFG